MASSPGPGSSGKHLPRNLGGAASKSYNVAQVWEQFAALSEGQLRVVEQLGSAASIRPLPKHVVDDRRQGEAGTLEHPGSVAEHISHKTEKDSYRGTLEDAVLHNANQFHKWAAELEAACASETEDKYKRYADLLTSHLRTADSILAKVDSTLDLMDHLQAQQRDVAQRSRSLHGSCEQLVREKDALVELAEAIRTKLRAFDDFDMVYAQCVGPAGAATLSATADNESLLLLLSRLDECAAPVTANAHYADASQYAAKFRQVQGRALGAVRTKVQAVLRAAVMQVQAAVAAAVPNANGAAATAATSPAVAGSAPPVLAEGSEVPLLYVRFRAAAEPSIKGLLAGIESRAVSRPEYGRLLQECKAQYAAARLSLVAPYVQRRVQDYGSQPLPLCTRNGCEYLARVCQLESQLFEQFFPGPPQQQQGEQAKDAAAAGAAAGGSAQDLASLKPITSSGPLSAQAQAAVAQARAAAQAEALAPLMEPLATALYDVLRPQIVVVQDLDELCELVDILKHEVLGEQLHRRNSGAEALRPVMARCLADVQGRLIYRAQASIKDEVASYNPTPEDVDYPARPAAQQQQQQQAAASAAAGSADNGAEDGESSSAQAASAAPAVRPDPYAALYPPLRTTLLLLSKLYRALDSSTFGGLAQEGVSACSSSVQQASRQVARRSGPLDAQLFMIRNLLFLREQIAPFDVDFAATDIDLDFSHMRDHLRRIMAGRESLFTLSASNAVVRMLGQGGPRVTMHQVDSKKDLEKALKGVCEAFIMALTKVAVEPMLSFITKVTAVRVAGASGGNAQASKPLREQAFASPAKVAEMVTRVNEALAGPLPQAVAKMRMYLANPATHAILLKPVKSNIAEAHGQIASLLQTEYSPEEIAEVPLKQPPELAALLEALG